MTELAIKEATIEKGEKREQRNNTKVLVQSLKKALEKEFGPGQWKVKLITFVGAQSTQGRLTKREIGFICTYSVTTALISAFTKE